MTEAKTKLRAFDKVAFESVLTDNILKFWTEKMVDLENGGFYGRMDHTDGLDKNAPKGLILNARILWTYSSAYQTLGKMEYYQMAQKAFSSFRDFKDVKSKGAFWMLSAQGLPIDTKKQIYAQAFAMYGLSEYYKISKNPLALNWAIELYGLIEKYSFDQAKNGYFEAFDREWKLLEDLRLSDKDENEVKTMNTHLHVLEAYTSLFHIWKNDHLKESLKNLTELFYSRFLDENNHFKLFFDEDWNSKSNEISYGHDIEAGWLLHEAALALGDPLLITIAEQHAVDITTATLPYFDADGALFNAGIPAEITDREKHWWPQAEALVGLVNAYQISGDVKFKAMAEKCWHFIQDKIIDHQNGEWIWGLDENHQKLKEDKAGPWKCPYHNGRAMIELIKRS